MSLERESVVVSVSSHREMMVASGWSRTQLQNCSQLTWSDCNNHHTHSLSSQCQTRVVVKQVKQHSVQASLVTLQGLQLPLWQGTLPVKQHSVQILLVTLHGLQWPLWQGTMPIKQHNVQALLVTLQGLQWPLWQGTMPVKWHNVQALMVTLQGLQQPLQQGTKPVNQFPWLY